jgi:hypothetical protein
MNSGNQKNIANLGSSDWGNTAVLFISTHGTIMTHDSTESVTDKYAYNPDVINTFVVPEGITIKRASVSAPGECNIVSEDFTNTYARYVNNNIRSLTSNNETTQDNAINKVLKTIRTKDTKDLKRKRQDYITDVLKSNKDREYSEDVQKEIEDERGYINQFDKGFTFQVFSSGDTIINKFYTRTNVQSTINDWVIKIMNLEGQPDLLSFLKRQTRHGDSDITLEDIVNFLITKNVKNIILIDLTCSLIRTEDMDDYPQRKIRDFRKDIISRKIGGKIKSVTKKFGKKRRKSRKNKKRSNRRY